MIQFHDTLAIKTLTNIVNQVTTLRYRFIRYPHKPRKSREYMFYIIDSSTFAINLVDKNVNLFTMKKRLGNSHIAVTPAQFDTRIQIKRLSIRYYLKIKCDAHSSD